MAAVAGANLSVQNLAVQFNVDYYGEGEALQKAKAQGFQYVVNTHKLGLAAIEEYTQVRGGGDGPQLRSDPLFPSITVELNSDTTTAQIVEDHVKPGLANFLNQNGYFPFGIRAFVDLVKTAEKVVGFIRFAIDQWPKAGAASDNVTYIKGKDDQGQMVIYSVFGKRANPPGKNKLATIGGFLAVKDPFNEGVNKFASAPYTAVVEANQEMNQRTGLSDAERKELRNNVDFRHQTISLQLKDAEGHNKYHEADLTYAGTVRASEDFLPEGGERIPGSKELRVDLAYAFATTLDLKDQVINEEMLKQTFKPGDDVTKLNFVNVTDLVTRSVNKDGAYQAATELHQSLEMGIKHHKDVLALTAMVAYDRLVRKEEDRDPQAIILDLKGRVSGLEGQLKAQTKKAEATSSFSRRSLFVAVGAVVALAGFAFKRGFFSFLVRR